MLFEPKSNHNFRDGTARQKMPGVTIRRRHCTRCHQNKTLEAGYQFRLFVCAQCMREKMKIKLLRNGIAPKYAKPGDAGLDLMAAIDKPIALYPGEQHRIGTGICAEIPEHHVGLLFPRSGLGSRGLVLGNTVGVIDSSYRGEIIAVCRNTGNDKIEICPGDRFVQLIVMPFCRVAIDVVEELSETDRGAGGFGHSGVQ